MKKNIHEQFLQKLYNVRLIKNFRDIVYDSEKLFGNKKAFEINVKDKIKGITYKQLKRDFQHLCTALIDLGYLGKRIAVVGKNSYEWSLAYLCASCIGVVVPIDKEISTKDMCNFLNDGLCSLIIGDSGILKKIEEINENEINYISNDEKLYKIIDQGEKSYKKGNHTIDTLYIDENEMHIILFTSGTTGSSKGVCLSQKNICSNILSTARMVKLKDSDKVLSILPIHHTYECTLGFLLVIYSGGCIAYNERLAKIPHDLLEYSPSVSLAVPDLLKHMHKKISKGLVKNAPEKYRKYFEELSIEDAMKKVPFVIAHFIKKSVKKTLGGKFRLFIVGAAGIDAMYIRDFKALGIMSYQGYGLTECSPLLAGNNDFFMNPDSTGLPIYGVEIKIENPNQDGIGEIVAKGDNIMLGYYNDEEATKEVFRGGYFHTGDLGKMDKDKFLYICGRIKNVIVTSNGKNIYPEELETRLYDFEEIGEALVLGGIDKRNETCVKAKIFPNLTFIKDKVSDVNSKEEVAKVIKNVIDSINDELPTYKRIATFEIIENEFEKTSTKKIKRYGTNIS